MFSSECSRSIRLLFGIILASFSVQAAPVEVEPVHGTHAMVVAGHPEAAAIGVEVLREGGNAIDAAVAVSLALGVAEPYASGLGGKFLFPVSVFPTLSAHEGW